RKWLVVRRLFCVLYRKNQWPCRPYDESILKSTGGAAAAVRGGWSGVGACVSVRANARYEDPEQYYERTYIAAAAGPGKEFTEDAKIGTGLNYLGERAADGSGRDHIPAYVVWDLMMSYRFSPHFSAQLNGYNLTNKLYFTNSYDTTAVENHIVPGAGRTGT